MTITELLEAHRYEPTSYLVRIASCSCGDWKDDAPMHLAEHFDTHRAHVAEVLEQHMQEREAAAKEAELKELAFILNAAAEDGAPAIDGDYDTGYISGIIFAEKAVETLQDKLKESSDGR